jgi:radical SAM protein with 4Fe4S-binding SPASM domain
VADRFRIDSHKLMYHLPRVADWLAGRPVYPIAMEVSPSGSCNHRCLFCAVDYLEYQPRFLAADIIKARLTELAGLGLKSVMFAGEGEPLLHRDIAGIVAHTRAAGIEAALVSNAALLREELARALLPNLTWLKVSCNAGTAATYTAVHRTRPEDFERVMANLAAAVRIRREGGLACTIGIQLLLLPENAHEVAALAARAREIGLDYLVVKPYSHFDRSKTTRYRDIRYEEYRGLAEQVRALATASFDVIFREETMRLHDEAERTYGRCLALPFYSYIDAGGTVWGCKEYLGDERFAFGNINEQSFREIWDGPRRAAVTKFVAEELDVRGCRTNCRLDKMNRWLWDVSHPAAHSNFI